MAAVSPPVPPAPPAPPRSGGNLIAIVLLSLALIVVVCVLAVWTGLRFITHNVQVHVHQGADDRKQFSVKTPFGGLEVNKDDNVSEAALGLPIYPGSTRLRDNDSASVNLALPGEQSVRIVAAKFRTPDPVDRVASFYHDRLAGQVTKFKERDEEGKTVFEIKHADLDKVVALQRDGDGTRIELVRVAHGAQEGN